MRYDRGKFVYELPCYQLQVPHDYVVIFFCTTIMCHYINRFLKTGLLK